MGRGDDDRSRDIVFDSSAAIRRRSSATPGGTSCLTGEFDRGVRGSISGSRRHGGGGGHDRLFSLDPLERLEDRLRTATLLVNSFADNITDTSHLTLRNAITLVNNGGKPASLGQSGMPVGWASQISGKFGDHDTIEFSSALSGDTITLDGSALALSANVTITGLGASNLAISGNNTSLIFQVDQESAGRTDRADPGKRAGNVVKAGVDARVNGVTCSVTDSSGGAINNAGTLTIQQSTLTDNVAGGLYSYGGAIDNAGHLTLISSTLSDNAASDVLGWGGGGAIYNTGSLNLINSTLVDNAVTTGATVTGLGTSPNPGGGGAIDNVGTLTVTSSTVAGNAATVGGGIVNATAGHLVLTNTLVATNTAATAPDISGARQRQQQPQQPHRHQQRPVRHHEPRFRPQPRGHEQRPAQPPAGPGRELRRPGPDHGPAGGQSRHRRRRGEQQHQDR